ncbi:MAG TPA: MFS transporter [Polyangia bacterium]|nr:MFS transporter [Polyangia bacterium]
MDAAASTLSTDAAASALANAKRKAFWRLLPLCFICYVVAYVDRTNISIAKLTMKQSLPWLTSDVYGFAGGAFFWGYFLLEIPGSILVERWSARKWISRIMITWGIIAASTAFVKTPTQFTAVRFLLGLGEAGFFPGIIIYLTHWFPSRDRARALSVFLIATPAAQILGPKLTGAIVASGTTTLVGLTLKGWQWVFIVWGLPATVLGVVVFFALTDRPRQASWLTPEERDALEDELARERAATAAKHRMTLAEAFRNPKVLLLVLAYFFVVAGNYGVIEFFLPSILDSWYHLKISSITTYMMFGPALALASQLFVGWSSDRTRERRMHTVIPVFIGGIAFVGLAFSRGNLALTIACVAVAAAGTKAYQPAFWALPSMFLTSTAAAGSIGFINSFGNLGGGGLATPVMGYLEKSTGSYVVGILIMAASMFIAAAIVFFLGLGKKSRAGIS